MSSAKESLMGMGFPEARAVKALAMTNNGSIDQAMDWIFKHQDDPDIDEPYVAPQGNTVGSPSTEQTAAAEVPMDTEGSAAVQGGENLVAKSLVCQDTGKVFRSMAEAQAYAERTGHANFAECTEEKKPLTAEQKAEQMAKLNQRMQEKKQARLKAEADEKLEKEKLRRTTGKDVGKLQQEHKQRLAEKRAAAIRKEKAEDKLALQRIREQVAKDKAERAAARVKKPSDATPATAVLPAPSQPAAAKAPAKEYTECRIQVRAAGSKPISNKFKTDDTVHAVFDFVRAQMGAQAPGRFTLSTSHPRKEFTEANYDVTLKDAGMVPSAALNLRVLQG